jgi:hypothetical protein
MVGIGKDVCPSRKLCRAIAATTYALHSFLGASSGHRRVVPLIGEV